MKKFLVLVFLLSQTVFANETLLLPTKIGNTVFNVSNPTYFDRFNPTYLDHLIAAH